MMYILITLVGAFGLVSLIQWFIELTREPYTNIHDGYTRYWKNTINGQVIVYPSRPANQWVEISESQYDKVHAAVKAHWMK